MKKKGVGLIVLSIVLAIVFILFSRQHKNNKEKKLITTPAVTYINKVSQMTPNTIPEKNENLSTKIRILNINKKQLKHLGISSKQLEKRMKIYANESGYPGVDKAYYCNEMIFNSNDKTISALFNFRYNHQNYKFYVVRYGKKILFKPF